LLYLSDFFIIQKYFLYSFVYFNEISKLKKIMVKKIFVHLIMFIIGIGAIALAIWVVMLLWNSILPDLTGWGEIGFWQSAGLCVMFRIMTGHIGFSYNKRGRRRKKHGHWRDKYKIGTEDSAMQVEICKVEYND